jgi:hypothetical protein
VEYYLERRDPDFEAKMREVLLFYQEVALGNQNGGLAPLVITLSVDEKPGLQAIENTAPDLPPVPGRHASLGRDHEYKRLGTCSILAALDLHSGHVTGRVERRHRSCEFIALLKDLDDYYPAGCTIPFDSGQPFGAHLKRDAGLSRNASEPIQIRPDAQAWIVAQHRGSPLREDDANLPAEHPRAVVGRTSRTHPEGHRRDQC